MLHETLRQVQQQPHQHAESKPLRHRSFPDFVALAVDERQEPRERDLAGNHVPAQQSHLLRGTPPLCIGPIHLTQPEIVDDEIRCRDHAKRPDGCQHPSLEVHGPSYLSSCTLNSASTTLSSLPFSAAGSCSRVACGLSLVAWLFFYTSSPRLCHKLVRATR